MSAVVLRLGVLAVVSLVAWLIVWAGKKYVGRSRRRALNSAPIVLPQVPGAGSDASRSAVSILAFSSADCRQCKQLQEPALQRVLAARSGSVAVVTVDAPGSPDLTEHYSVLTVPTTVVLDASGKAHAVNYGFAPAQRLLEQVDALLKG
jgi:thiol:disulfide interchange protein